MSDLGIDMELLHPLHPSVHDSRVGCGIEKPQLPGINFLLQLSGYRVTFRDAYPPLLLSSSPTSTSILENLENCYSESKHRPHNHERTYSPSSSHDSSSVDTQGKGTVSQHNSLLNNIHNTAQQRISETQSSPLTATSSWKAAYKDSTAYRVTKNVNTRRGVPAPREVIPQSKSQRPYPRQITSVSSRLPALRTIHRVQGSQPNLSQDLISSNYGNANQQRTKLSSSTRNPVRSQISISALLSSSSSSVQPSQRVHSVTNDANSATAATSLTLPNSYQPQLQEDPNNSSHSLPRQQKALRAGVHQTFSAATDPVEIDEALTRHYLNAFFDQSSILMFDVLARHRFVTWAMRSSHKSLPDRIMLYALMSCATLCCTNTAAADHRVIFKAIVYCGITLLQSQPCLQVVHALLCLTLTEYGDHRYRAGSQAFARCVDTMSALRLNIEQIDTQVSRVYDFTASVDAECRRRTFWAAFCFDSHMQLDNPFLQQMNESGLAIKLPSVSKLYDCEWLLQQPCFESKIGLRISGKTRDSDTLSDMAHMIQLTRIHTDIGAHVSQKEIVHRTTNRHPDDQSYRRCLHVRLRVWIENYNYSSHSKESHNFNNHNRFGDPSQPHDQVHTGSIGGLHMLYYHSQMRLNRRIYRRGLNEFELSFHARHATLHAIATLRLAEQVVGREDPDMRNCLFVSRSPSTVFAILEAIDVITAVGRVSDILEPGSRIMSLMYSALDLLVQLGSWWGFDMVKYELVKQRIQIVFRSAEAAWRVQRKFFYCSDPIDTSTSKDFDLVYGPDRKHYIRLAYSDTVLIDDKDIYKIDTSRSNNELS